MKKAAAVGPLRELTQSLELVRAPKSTSRFVVKLKCNVFALRARRLKKPSITSAWPNKHEPKISNQVFVHSSV